MYPILILESESGPSEAEKGGGLDENETFEEKKHLVQHYLVGVVGNLEIAVDQHTRARYRTFEGVPDAGCPSVPAGQTLHITLTCSKPCFGVLYL